VLHVIPSLAIGGTEGQLVGFIGRSGQPARHHVAVLDEAGPLASELPNPVILAGPVGRDPWHPGRFVGAAVGLRQAMRGCDLVHAHLGLAEVLVAACAPRAIPFVASRRGRNTGFDGRLWLRVLEAFGRSREDVLICNARYWADRVPDLWAPQIEVVHNAVDLDRFAVEPLPPERSTVVVVANLKPQKGHERFLRALALARSRVATARAVLVGDGSERSRLERLSESLDVADAVTFVGQVLDPRPHLKQAAVAALTSDHEGFPNALLEAMALGRPVVATRVGGIPELVRDGQDGFLTGPSPGEIADALVRLFTDGALLARMAVSARARAETYPWDRVVRETEAVYRRVIDRRARGRPSSAP